MEKTKQHATRTRWEPGEYRDAGSIVTQPHYEQYPRAANGARTAGVESA